jgi:hypothetical protein
MTKKIPTKEEALQPFKEKTELVDGFIEEIREKLGEDEATKINDTLVGLRTTVTETSDLIETTVDENLKYAERNRELADVNNELYIKNRDALKPNTGKPNPNEDDDDDDDPLETYGDLATTKGK